MMQVAPTGTVQHGGLVSIGGQKSWLLLINNLIKVKGADRTEELKG